MKSLIDKVYIISEIHPQHGGDMKTVEQMILQSKMAGMDAIKLQIYSSQKLFGDDRKEWAELTYEEVEHIKVYADQIGIEVFASAFDIDRMEWCEKLGFRKYKIATRTVSDTDLCNAIIKTGKTVFASVNLGDNPFPYKADNLRYFYCVANYPTLLEEIRFPEFRTSYVGFSDHTIGLTASKVAVVKGAMYIEKHFTLSCSLQSLHEKGHVGGMTFEDALELRRFCDEYVRIGNAR